MLNSKSLTQERSNDHEVMTMNTPGSTLLQPIEKFIEMHCFVLDGLPHFLSQLV